MDYLPLFAKLDGRRCVVVGGGEVAWRKARMLLKAGARLFLVAPEVNREIAEAAENGELVWINQPFRPEHLDATFLVIAATDNPLVNELVAKAADNRHILANVVDDTPKCSFIVPSIVDRSPLIVAISSSGQAPVLARLIREKLETLLPQHLGQMAKIAGQFRDTLKARVHSLSGRRKFWEQAFEGRFSSLVAAGQHDEAQDELERLSQTQKPGGSVALVGAGPGDAGLLTLKAVQLMQQADVVLYDYLVSEEVLELVRRDAELVSVGKKAGFHSVPQDQINQLLVDYAKAGKRVVRLKGGDPFVFGRGGEELETLMESGVTCQVVPGITAAAGATAYAGIPLTHRDYAQSATFITGHLKQEVDTLDWVTLARPNQTLVIYMGLMKSGYIQQRLLDNGRDPHTPVAIIERGTQEKQKVLRGTLSELTELAKSAESPSLIVVGEVAQLSEKLNWFSSSRDNGLLQDKKERQPAPAVVNLA